MVDLMVHIVLVYVFYFNGEHKSDKLIVLNAAKMNKKLSITLFLQAIIDLLYLTFLLDVLQVPSNSVLLSHFVSVNIFCMVYRCAMEREI